MKAPKKHISVPGILLLGMLLLSSFVPSSNEYAAPASDHIFGIDISHYQGKVDWVKLATCTRDIEFVFIRSTMGTNREDQQFDRNWKNAGDSNYIRGAYHYYRPYENSTKQFRNFSRHVKLGKGDFPPILDIEKPSPYGTENLRRGIKNWLKMAEVHYGVKPVIYTGRKFYDEYLKGHVDGYPLWIASYSNDPQLKKIDWTIHQFSDRLRIRGIEGYVDGNNFRGDLEKLSGMCID